MKIEIKDKIDYMLYINYALVGYAFFLPFSKAGVNLFETMALLLWLFSGHWKEQWNLYKKNIFLIAFLSFLLLSLISILWADDTMFAIKYVLKYRHFLILFVIYWALQEEYIKHIFSAFLLGMFLSELVSYGIFFEIIHYKNILPSDPSPFMSHTDYSIYLSFASMILLTRIMREPLVYQRVIYMLFFLTVTTNLFVNGGRTGQVTFIILVVINFMHHYTNKLKAIIVAMGLLLVVFSLAYNYSPNFQQRLHNAKAGIEDVVYHDNYSSDGLNQRFALWRLGLDKLQDNFLLGTGIGADMKGIEGYTKQRGFAQEVFNSKTFGDHHNMFLTFSIQLGIIGFLNIVLIFYALFRLQYRTYTYKILGITFLTAFSLWSFGGMTFHTMNPMIFFSLFAGLFNKISYMENKAEA